MPETDAAIAAAVDELWPGARLVDARADGVPGPLRARFAVLPDRREPRLLVPVDASAARTVSLRRPDSGWGWTDSLTGLVTAASLRVAPGLVLRDVVEVRGGGDGLDRVLEQLLGTPVAFSVRPGAAMLPRKLVLQVFDRSGRALAVVKIGTTVATADAVRTEERALEALAQHHFTLLRAPGLIGSTTWQGHPLILTEALPLPAWQPLSGWEPPTTAMEELAASFSEVAPLDRSSWWQRQWDATTTVDPVLRGRLGRCLERTAQLAGDRAIEWGPWHGDWNPWNMTRRGRQILLWDWARFEPDAPGGLDRVHFQVSLTVARHGDNPDVLLAALGNTQRGAIEEGSTAHVRGLLYLVAMATRYTGLLEIPGSGHLASRTESIVVALEELSGEVREGR